MTPEEIAAGVAELVTEAVRGAVLDEREACAKIADAEFCREYGCGEMIAARIRERAD